jgi:hypothetical protein
MAPCISLIGGLTLADGGETRCPPRNITHAPERRLHKKPASGEM